MFIYVDESGSFVPRRAGKVVDCVGAVVVPERDHDAVLTALLALPLPRTNDGELKGSGFDAGHIRQVVECVYDYADVLVFVDGADLSLTTPQSLGAFKRQQADKIVAHVPETATPFVKSHTARLRDGVLALPDQLFVQLVLLTELADSIVRWSSMYYSLQLPPALAKFAWRIDPKDPVRRTRYEQVWMDLVCGFVQALSLADPHVELEEGDYSSMARFRSPLTSVPEHLKSFRRHPDRPFRATDVGRIFEEDREFPDSRTSPGVQLADIFVGALRRAFNGDLPWDVSQMLARMVCRRPERNASPILLLDGGTAPSLAGVRRGWSRMANEVDRRGRRWLAPDPEPLALVRQVRRRRR